MKTKETVEMKTKLISAFAMLLISMSASANIIDLFTAPAGGQVVSDVVNGGTGDFNEADDTDAPGSIIGGYRDLIANAVSGANDVNNDTICDNIDSCTTLSVFNGVLTLNNDTGVNGYGEVQWDGNDNSAAFDPTGLDGANLVNQEGCPASGCTQFTFEVLAADQGFNFTIAVYTDATAFTEFNLVSTGATGPDSFLFSDFENAALCGLGSGVIPGVNSVTCGSGNTTPVDMTNVGGMFVRLNTQNPGTTAVDLAIGAITKVPEPGLLALLGMAFAAAGVARRRKSKI